MSRSSIAFVTDPASLCNAWRMAQAMKCRPSVLYGLRGFVAYAFDSAITLWGSAFDSALQGAVEGAKDSAAARRKQMAVLRRWVPLGAAGYRDPARG